MATITTIVHVLSVKIAITIRTNRKTAFQIAIINYPIYLHCRNIINNHFYALPITKSNWKNGKDIVVNNLWRVNKFSQNLNLTRQKLNIQQDISFLLYIY